MMIARGGIEAWGTGSGNEGPVLSEPERLRERPGPGRVAKCHFFYTEQIFLSEPERLRETRTRPTRESRRGKMCSRSFFKMEKTRISRNLWQFVI